MSWTKRQLISEAFAELGLAGHEFDITPEEQQTALRRLDTMMAAWEVRGVRIGYAFPSSPDDSDPDTDSGLPDYAVEAAYRKLSISLAPSFGKQVSSDTKRAANDAYDVLLWSAAQPIEQQQPSTMPRGAGSRIASAAQQPFFPTPSNSPLAISQGGDLDILPE